MWEEWKLIADHPVVASQAMVESMEEDEKEADGKTDVGKAPLLEICCLNRCWHCRLPCLRCPDFGRQAQVTR